MLNIHIRTHCDTFHCKQTRCNSHVNGKRDRGNASEIQAACNNKIELIIQMPWFSTIWYELKIAECEHYYGARKLC